MKKLGSNGRKWLIGIHILFSCLWIGTAVSMLLTSLVKGHSPNGDELFAVYSSIKLLDDFIIIPAALGSFFTGLLICWLTNWGFVKFNWVILKWAVTLALIIFGTFWLGPWTNGATAISYAERALALQNVKFLYFWKMTILFGSIQLAILVALVFISVFKPWGKRGGK